MRTYHENYPAAYFADGIRHGWRQTGAFDGYGKRPGRGYHYDPVLAYRIGEVRREARAAVRRASAEDRAAVRAATRRAVEALVRYEVLRAAYNGSGAVAQWAAGVRTPEARAERRTAGNVPAAERTAAERNLLKVLKAIADK